VVPFAALALLAASCTDTAATTAPTATTGREPAPPNLQQFLQLPVATPVACARGSVATATGRVSPWTGHVDISVFLAPGSPRSTRRTVTSQVSHSPLVATTYDESQRQAHEEYARLYTCSGSVATADTPASLRIVLQSGTTTAQRNRLVVTLVRDRGVDSVSCDPSNPCVDVVRSAQPVPPAG
jgi:hypothetical protein